MTVIVHTEPVLVCTCHEPEGEVERSVYKMDLTVENLNTFWNKARQFNQLFDANINGDFAKFSELFLYEAGGQIHSRGLFWVVDDFVGVFYMTHIVPGTDAEVHYTYFDRRHRGRTQLGKEMLKYAFRKYKFRRLSTDVPAYARPQTHSYVRNLGFTNEGRKRKGIWFNDDWFDVINYGILQEEVLR